MSSLELKPIKTEEEKKKSAVIASLKWRSKNREVYNAIQIPLSRQYYQKNKILVREKAMKKYYYKKEAQVFRNILLNHD